MYNITTAEFDELMRQKGDEFIANMSKKFRDMEWPALRHYAAK